MAKNCVLLFVKAPVKGQVKKRLAAELNEELVVELYRNFILDHLLTLKKLPAQCIPCFYPSHSLATFNRWLGGKYSYLPQRGRNLGERMKHCFEWAFNNGFSKAVLMGSDIPDLPPSFIKKAFLSLNTHEVVIGPAQDGGYYLIGFRNDTFLPEVFKKVRWGSNTVLRNTLQKLKAAGYNFQLLPLWKDIDTLDELLGLVRRNRHTKFRHSKTISFLARIGLNSKKPIA